MRTIYYLAEMEIFDNLINPTRKNRTVIELCRSTDEILNIWEISSFIDGYFCNYYKFYLLNCVSSALQYGIAPENIFVLDRSISPSNYFGIDILDHIALSAEYKDYELYRLYSVGKPFSMLPNMDIFLINQIFTYCREINLFLYESCRGSLPHGFISFHTNLILERKLDYYHFLRILSNKALVYFPNAHSDKEHDKAYKKIEEIIVAAKSNYKNFMKKCILSNTPQHEYKFSQEENIKSINTFYSYITRVKRPLVGIYYDKLKMIQILGLPHINSAYNDPSFLDLKRMGHNSPSVFEFIGDTITSLGTLKKTLNDDRRAQELHELALYEKQLDILIKLERLQQEQEKTRDSVLRQTLTEMESNREANLLSEGAGNISAAKSHIDAKMLEAYKNIQTNTAKLVTGNGFDIKRIDKSV